MSRRSDLLIHNRIWTAKEAGSDHEGDSRAAGRLRRLLAVSAILAAALLAGGCSRAGAPASSASASKGSEAAEETTEKGRPQTDFHMNEEPIAVNRGEQLTIGFSQVGAESDWRLASSASMEQVFTSDNGYNLIFSDGQQKQENQIKAIREFIDQDVDYIILDPVTETGWDSSLQEAKDAQIPVIIVDREVKVGSDDLYTVWVGSDFRLEGDRACAWLDAFLKAQDPEGLPENIGIVDIQGTMGASAQIGRSEALAQAVKEHENWTLLEAMPGDFVQARGREVMEELLGKYKDRINVVYSENDNMTYGVLEALRNEGIKAGTNIGDGEVLVISFDSARQGLEETLKGTIAVDTECNPLYGPVLSRTIMALEQGEELPRKNYYEERQFSAAADITEVTVGDTAYPVTLITREIIDGREY